MKATEKILNIQDIDTVLDYLVDELDWPIQLDEFEYEDLSYNYEPEELNLSPEFSANIETIKQLRPLINNQPWGIFFIEFEQTKLPISALRKILFGLIPSRKNQKNSTPTWNQQDLLFICFCGEKTNKTIAFVHFSGDKNSLPSLKTFYWQPNIEANFQHVYDNLNKLRWPEDEQDQENWKKQWASAFTFEYKQRVKSSEQLSKELAKLAKKTKNLIIEVYAVENKKGALNSLFDNFKQELIHDLTVEQFADMYAQTVAYGLFYAKCMKSGEGFELSEVTNLIPATNPFLKQLLMKCFEHGIASSNIDFDELEIGQIVQLLAKTDTEEILKDFGRRTGGGTEDPVIHFYEGFLNEYEKEQKKERGVFYTPDPVVDFMTKFVDQVLKNKFNYVDGLADTSMKKVKTFRESLRKNSKGFHSLIEEKVDVPAVQILDPATGTATFLKSIILQVKKNFDEKYINKSKSQLNELWSEFVSKHLLPRLFGFEIMMAPYTVAHMKLGLILKDTGYDFSEKERLNIFLTNALEEAKDENRTMFNFQALSEESSLANHVKKSEGLNVIIGNPPYLGHSSNENPFIRNLLRGLNPDGTQGENYFESEGKSLGERNTKWLNDDYVKFMRLGQSIIERSKEGGILAYITNHGYLDNPTFRGMRESLLNTFDDIYIIDLHGSVKKNKLKCPDGTKDENVFNIQQGVAIAFFIKYPRKSNNKNVFHADLWGTRDFKFQWFKENNIDTIDWKRIEPNSPHYLLNKNLDLMAEYGEFWSIKDIMQVNTLGFQTHRDNFAIALDNETIENRISDLINDEYSNTEILEKYGLKENKDWQLTEVRNKLRSIDNWKEYLIPCYYRPFDYRSSFFSKLAMDRPRVVLQKHMTHPNISFLISRQVSTNEWRHILVADTVANDCAISTKTKEANYVFPFYLYEKDSDKNSWSSVNLEKTFIRAICERIKLNYIEEPEGNLYENIGFMDIFGYIYAVLNSTFYQFKYENLLKLDYPRVPLPKNLKYFKDLCELGKKLLDVQLLKKELNIMVRYKGDIEPIIDDKIVEVLDGDHYRIDINVNSSIYNIPVEVWEYYAGSHQVCKKWLEARVGTALTQNDLKHFFNIVSAVSETLSIKKEIDDVFQEDEN